MVCRVRDKVVKDGASVEAPSTPVVVLCNVSVSIAHI
jgi:hypothetical protein